MLQSIFHHSSAYFSTYKLAESEAVPEMSKVTYYHSNVRLSLTEFFSSFTLFSLTTKVLILLIERPPLKYKSKKTLLFWHVKIVLFHSRWKCFNRVDVYLWRATKSVPQIFLKDLGVLSSRYIMVVRESVNCPTYETFFKISCALLHKI
jgi:hypothetical protein